MRIAMKHALSLAIGSAIASSTPVFAQDSAAFTLEEVIVTAQKREQSLQDVPLSVNAVGGEKMAEAGITNLEGMTGLVPNLTFNQTGIGTNVAIRGISSGINQGFEQSVGQYVDGIYYGRAQLTRAPMFDMERVEVLRGPQSILFGKNSIAGAISMTSAKPTDEFEAKIGALYEPEHDEQQIDLVVSGPITENLSGRLAIMDRTMDGYFDNEFLDNDEQDDDETFIRGTLVWDASDDLSVTLKVEDGSFDSKGRNIGVTQETTLGATSYEAQLDRLTGINANQGLLTGGALPSITSAGSSYSLNTNGDDFERTSNGDFSENDMENVTITVEYGIGDYTLTSITGYNAYEYTEHCDCDFISAELIELTSEEEFEQYSQEFRITSPGGETIDWIAGIFYQENELEFDDKLVVPEDSLLPTGVAFASALAAVGGNPLDPGFNAALGGELVNVDPMRGASSSRDFDQESELWSIFAQATWNITDETRLTLGARYTDEEKEASRRQFHLDANGAVDPTLTGLFGAFGVEEHSIADDRDETSFTPLVTLQHDLTDDAMVYISWTTGYKSGGFDVRSNAHPTVGAGGLAGIPTLDVEGVFEFEEEEAESIEIGGKFTLLDGAAEMNVALFRTEYTDLQTSQFDGTLGFNVTNAGEATTQGLELDGRWRVSEGLTLSGALAYLDFEYDKFPNSQCAFGQTPNSTSHAGQCDISGETREFTPEWTGSLTADYIRPLGDALEFRSTLDLIYSDDYFTSPTLDSRTEQDSYTKVNLRLALGASDGQWEVALVGKNLTDEEVMSFSNQLPVSNSFTAGSGTAYYAFYDRPRSVALQGMLRF
ncbi:TonB-dependent receptor [Maricurvus nonylphenolicus]|uniref:TonB-dependent receptor n=1 Tax=Maricurvus nonylphenolicus TaxID=1008307 RepID=UPI0036F23C6B